jgi:REP element-mobilizing transposase RayT
LSVFLIKKHLWGDEFMSDGYIARTVGKHGDEETIRKFVKGQGGNYQKLHADHQLALF